MVDRWCLFKLFNIQNGWILCYIRVSYRDEEEGGWVSMNQARELLDKRICPCCGGKLKETPCVDAPDRVWVSCKGYPYCPTRLVVDRIGG